MGQDTWDIMVCLIAGHLLGDFVLQTDRMAHNKRKIGLLLLHVSGVTAVSYLVCGVWLSWRIAVGVFATHLIIDGIKTLAGKDGPRAFLFDQGGHLAALALIGGFWIPGAAVPYWQNFLPFYTKMVLLVAGGLLCIRVGGFWVAKAVAPFQKTIHRAEDSLPNAGRLIGQLERALIFLLVLVNVPQGVGFLVAAKSVLRFGEVREPNQRREAEYIIIGTLMSFGWALATAYATKALLNLLQMTGG